MPATDALHTFGPRLLNNSDANPYRSLEPPLSEAERAIVKSYGGWTQYTQSFGLKPWEQGDADEGKQILEASVADDK